MVKWVVCNTSVLLSRNHERDKYHNKYQGKNMLANLLQYLSKMFTGSDYQSRLEQYIAARHPQNAADVEILERQYFQDQQKGLI